MSDKEENGHLLEDNSGLCQQKGPTIMNLNSNKAGMSGLDSDAINCVIHEWSNGSNFHSFQTKRQQRIDEDIKRMMKRIKQMTEWQRVQCLRESDVMAKNIESTRDMTRIIVHIDLDMFFAAVEIKHRPELADKPIAVGSEQMLATSNYVARKFGVRPGMPGVLAKRLCPQLILIKHSFGSYSKESKEVMKIIGELDPNFCCMSLDECYIDLTEYTIEVYCHQNKDFNRDSLKGCTQLPNFLWDFASQLVANLRQKILNETELSASAGIAPNSMIAKVCSDVNKPNGQHMVRGNRTEIEEFLEKTPVRKICGIGPVRAQYLTALGINTCKDLWHKRDVIRFAFSQFNSEYYLKVGLGVGSTLILRDDDSRKSISSERTVSQISHFNEICDHLNDLSLELSSDLIERNQSCKTITVKLKKITFEVTLRSQTIPYYTSDSETILNSAKKLLETELSNTATNCQKYRLIGLKVSNLKDKKDSKRSVGSSQLTLSQIFTSLTKNDDKSQVESNIDNNIEEEDLNESHSYSHSLIYDSDVYECSVCSQRFVDKSLFENHENDCIGQMLCQNLDEKNSNDLDVCPIPSTSFESDNASQLEDQSLDNCRQIDSYVCPVCSTHFNFKDNDELNRHIDMCLNKDKCKELTQVPIASTQSTPNTKSTPNSKVSKRCSSDSKVKDKNSRNQSSKKSKTKSSKSQKTIDFFFHSQ